MLDFYDSFTTWIFIRSKSKVFWQHNVKVIFILLCQVVCHKGRPCVFFIMVYMQTEEYITVSDPVDSCSTELVLESAVEAYEEWRVRENN